MALIPLERCRARLVIRLFNISRFIMAEPVQTISVYFSTYVLVHIVYF